MQFAAQAKNFFGVHADSLSNRMAMKLNEHVLEVLQDRFWVVALAHYLIFDWRSLVTREMHRALSHLHLGADHGKDCVFQKKHEFQREIN